MQCLELDIGILLISAEVKPIWNQWCSLKT